MVLRFDQIVWLDYNVELGLHVKLLAVLQHCVDILKVGGAFPVVSICGEGHGTPVDNENPATNWLIVSTAS